EGRNLFGFLDFSLGRQYDTELFDFFAYDGFRLRLQGPKAFFIETYGGAQVDRARPFSPAVFETDGTAGESDEDNAWSPTFGIAVGVDVPSRFTCRLAYRGVASKAAAAKPPGEAPVGELPSSWAMDQEIIFGSMSVTLPGVRTRLAASTRYNILNASWDELTASVAQALGPGQRFEVEVLRSRPHFDGDSIFNVFALEAFHEVAGRYSLRPLDGLLFELRAGYRWMWQAENDDASPGSLSLAFTTTWRRKGFWATGDLFWMEGRAGRRLGGDLTTRWLSPRWIFGRRLGLEGRLSVIHFADGDRPLDEAITTLGIQGGAEFRLLPNVRLHLTVENNVSRLYRSALRVLAVVDMVLSP
ncbi:MAG: hypothetical protein KAI47_00580, partial [Deltaproteobacteria bacterium]|nr:hypothetical protein [Deltaproteobacteria bacterium]